VSSREERLAQNEIFFRRVNERIAELTDRWPGVLDLVCECANARCHEVLHMQVDEYEQLRSNPRRFAVVPGHELPDIEAVVEQHDDRYLVVEKHSGSVE
jgi:hypothetical protein